MATLPGFQHLKLSHFLFQVANALFRLPDLRIQALLHLGVGRLAHSVGGIDYDPFPLNLSVDLVDELIMIHVGGVTVLPSDLIDSYSQWGLMYLLLIQKSQTAARGTIYFGDVSHFSAGLGGLDSRAISGPTVLQAGRDQGGCTGTEEEYKLDESRGGEFEDYISQLRLDVQYM